MPKPKAKVDPKQIETLASIGCTVEEMALVVGCSKDTLERRFMGNIEKGRAFFKVSLRRKQVELANSGNVGMLIWLGKQCLGQKERLKTESEQKIDVAGAHVHKILDNDERAELKRAQLLKELSDEVD